MKKISLSGLVTSFSAMLLTSSCGSQEPLSSNQEFIESIKEKWTQEKVSLELPSFSSLNYQVFKVMGKESWVSTIDSRFAKTDQFFYRVLFSRLSNEQFDYLKNRFWKENSLSYEKRDYWLVEFLPPAMQSLFGNTFKVQDEYLPSNILKRSNKIITNKADIFLIRPKIKSLSNCWTTAYELLRSRSDYFTHFFASDRALIQYIGSGDLEEYSDEDTEFSTFIKALDWKESCYSSSRETACPENSIKKRNKGLKIGDLLTIYSAPDEIQHAAIYLGDDLYFEKAGAQTGYLYRINHYFNIRETYRDEQFSYRYRRFNSLNKKQLPNPFKVFGYFDKEEKDVFSVIPEEHQKSWKAIHQPSEGTARDLSIYFYKNLRIEKTSSSLKNWNSHYSLGQTSLKEESFLPSF